MEAVVDKVVSELTTFKDTTSANGGCSDIMTIEAVYFGDPGVIPVNSYPCFLVQPIRDRPEIGTTGYDVRDLEILISLLIDAREFFDASTLEATGDRAMVQVMERVRKWFRRKSNRSLDGLSGVREVRVTATDFNVQVRGAVIAKAAQVTLLVNKQFSREV